MDDIRFDQIARSVAGSRSRRGFLKALAGGVAAGLVAAVGARDASAKPPEQECRNKGQTCSAVMTCCDDLHCCKGHCQEEPCKPCKAGQKVCDGKCTSVKSDENNCGECGNVCSPGQTCSGGHCKCPGGTELCDGECLDVSSDQANCGACGRTCAEGTICSDGDCVLPPVCRGGDFCAPFGESCDGLPCCSGRCVRGMCTCVAEGGTCNDQYDCCFGTACTNGTCQPVEDGTPCRTDANCGNGSSCFGGTCEPCYSGAASAGGITVDDCPWPMPGYVCPPDPATGYPGFGYCCIPGVNCGGDPCARPCPADNWASGGGAVCNGL